MARLHRPHDHHHPTMSSFRELLLILIALTGSCLALVYFLAQNLGVHEAREALERGPWLHMAAAAPPNSRNLGIHEAQEALERGPWLLHNMAAAGPPSSTRKHDVPAEDRVIIHFSTDCTSYQHWQAMTLLESAERVGQRGAIVRVVSGCEQATSLTGEDQLSQEQIRHDHAAFADAGKVPAAFRFYLFFVDDMTSIGKGNTTSRYKFAVKALSLHHWLDKLGGGTLRDVVGPTAIIDEDDEDVVIVSIDPDFLFMKPFGVKSLGLLTHEEMASTQSPGRGEVIARMRGRPIAQYYGLGSTWLQFPVCQADVGGCANVTDTEATKHYNAGPPYALHRRDWVPMLDAWTAAIPLVHSQYMLVDGPNQDPSKHYAEMYAWCIAAAQLHLAHTLLQQEMVGCMVYWPRELMAAAVQETMVARASSSSSLRCGIDSIIGPEQSDKLPAFLHYCQRHQFTQAVAAASASSPVEQQTPRTWIFYKRMVPHDLIFDCGPHLLEVPPPDSLGGAKAGENEDAFITCTLHEIINACKRRIRRSAACVGKKEEEEEERHDVRLFPGGGSRKIGQGQLEEESAVGR